MRSIEQRPMQIHLYFGLSSSCPIIIRAYFSSANPWHCWEHTIPNSLWCLNSNPGLLWSYTINLPQMGQNRCKVPNSLRLVGSIVFWLYRLNDSAEIVLYSFPVLSQYSSVFFKLFAMMFDIPRLHRSADETNPIISIYISWSLHSTLQLSITENI